MILTFYTFCSNKKPFHTMKYFNFIQILFSLQNYFLCLQVEPGNNWEQISEGTLLGWAVERGILQILFHFKGNVPALDNSSIWESLNFFPKYKFTLIEERIKILVMRMWLLKVLRTFCTGDGGVTISRARCTIDYSYRL